MEVGFDSALVLVVEGAGKREEGGRSGPLFPSNTGGLLLLQYHAEVHRLPYPLFQTSLRCVKHVKSNAITIAKDGRLLGMGSGQPNRVNSVRIAIEKSAAEVQVRDGWTECRAEGGGHCQRQSLGRQQYVDRAGTKETLQQSCGGESLASCIRLNCRPTRPIPHAFLILLQGSVLASDAFFPFSWGDSVEIACQAGVKAIVHPGGSLRDKVCAEEDQGWREDWGMGEGPQAYYNRVLYGGGALHDKVCVRDVWKGRGVMAVGCHCMCMGRIIRSAPGCYLSSGSHQLLQGPLVDCACLHPDYRLPPPSPRTPLTAATSTAWCSSPPGCATSGID